MGVYQQIHDQRIGGTYTQLDSAVNNEALTFAGEWVQMESFDCCAKQIVSDSGRGISHSFSSLSNLDFFLKKTREHKRDYLARVSGN